MINSFSLQHISKSGNLDSNLISRQYKHYLKANVMQINFGNPKMNNLK